MPDVGGIAGERLRSFIERIERLEEERSALGDDLREVYAEAKGNGFDPKIMRQIVRLRKMETNDCAEQEMLLDTYKMALGMIDSFDMPLSGSGQVSESEQSGELLQTQQNG
ncbi:MAG: hypothetical protein CMM28_10025 [Rhodospirillaceae bacterium]|nr:hypothetical protein [Rhodospirillaceae bacterium]